MLIAADDALNSAAEAGDRASREVDKKFRKAVRLLGGFQKDFPLKNLTSDQNIGGTVPGGAKMNDKSERAPTILYALKKNLHAKVKFPSVPLPLNADVV